MLLFPLRLEPASIHSSTVAPAPRPPAAAMNNFPDGTHVWLQSRARRGYLHADEDGSGVSLSNSRATLNAAWQVHRIVHGGVDYVLLRSAAYGRYLALSASLAADGHRGREAAQRDFNEPQQLNVRWRAVSAGDGSGYVLLYNVLVSEERFLRANGRYRRWNSGVTVDVVGNGGRSTMMHWTVMEIPLRPAPPALPNPSTVSSLPLLFPLLSLIWTEHCSCSWNLSIPRTAESWLLHCPGCSSYV